MEIGRFDSTGGYAERKAADAIRASWAQYLQSYWAQVGANRRWQTGAAGPQQPGHSVVFSILISRGPCGDCVTALIETRDAVRSAITGQYPGVDVRLRVRVPGVYGNLGYTWTDDQRGTMKNEPGDLRAGQFQVWRLLQQGVDVGILKLDDATVQAISNQLDGKQQWYIGTINRELRNLLTGIKNGSISF
jgi:hypothetical protein